MFSEVVLVVKKASNWGESLTNAESEVRHACDGFQDDGISSEVCRSQSTVRNTAWLGDDQRLLTRNGAGVPRRVEGQTLTQEVKVRVEDRFTKIGQ